MTERGVWGVAAEQSPHPHPGWLNLWQGLGESHRSPCRWSPLSEAPSAPCLPPLLSGFRASLWSVLSALLLTHPGWNYVQKLVNGGHFQDHRQRSAGTVQVPCLPKGLSRTEHWPSWVGFLGRGLLTAEQ